MAQTRQGLMRIDPDQLVIILDLAAIHLRQIAQEKAALIAPAFAGARDGELFRPRHQGAGRDQPACLLAKFTRQSLRLGFAEIDHAAGQVPIDIGLPGDAHDGDAAGIVQGNPEHARARNIGRPRLTTAKLRYSFDGLRHIHALSDRIDASIIGIEPELLVDAGDPAAHIEEFVEIEAALIGEARIGDQGNIGERHRIADDEIARQ